MAYAGKLTYKTELDTSGVQKSGNTIKSIIAGLGITKAISMAMSQISNSIDDAISRYDTLNNFPKVMSNLGIASDEADKSIKKMSDKLAGLPTTLDQGASAVQRFTSANNDVEKSTDIFLALNNAILAGGAGTEIQASALEQLSQAYAKGKPDMMEWRTAMTAMPAQLKQVATAMGFVNADELGEALREGTVSMDQFMDTIVQLNETGLEGFANFETQARNSTGGIATAITVAKTQIVKGVTDLITAINDGLAQADLPSISEIIAMVGQKAKEALDLIGSNIPSVINFLIKIAPILKTIGATILVVVSAITAYQKTVKIVTAVTKAWALIQAVLNGTLLLNPIGLIVAGIVALIAIIVLLYTKCEWFRDLVNLLFSHIVNAVKEIWTAIQPLATAVINIIKIILNALQPFIDWIKEHLVNFIKMYVAGMIIYIDMIVTIIKTAIAIITAIIKTIIDVIKSVIDFAKNIPTKVSNFVNRIVGFFKALPGKMLSIGLDIVRGIGNGITSGITWIKNKIKEFVGNVTSFIKKMFKIGSPSKLMEEEVGQYLPQGIAIGIEANTDSVKDAMDSMYDEINKTIKVENSKLGFNVMSGDIYNKTLLQTPVAIDINAPVELDGTKVGRLLTPVVTKTIKTGGGV